MKKILALMTILALLLSCAAFADEVPAEEPAMQTGIYLLTNSTGETVTKVTLTDNVTGDVNEFPYNKEDVLKDGEALQLWYDIPAEEDGSHRLTLSYTTESGREETFATLSIEDVVIDLLAADAMTGATPIAFGMPAAEQCGSYTLYNLTGEVVTMVSLTDNETGAAIKLGFDDGFAPDETQTISFAVPADRENVSLTLEFETESGKKGTFSTLHIEEVPISLLDVDAVGGATQISFTAPNP